MNWRSIISGVALLSLLLICRQTYAQCVVDGAQTNQTIDGFGVNINHRSWNNDELKPVLDAMIGQGGFSIFRVVFDNTDWEATNNTSQAYYNSIYSSARFEKLWDLVAYLNQKGITNGIMFNFQGPGPSWMCGQSLTPGYEPQWAQMIASLLIYARDTRHLQFNLVAPDNEPDIGSAYVGIAATQSQYVTMLNLLAQNLGSNGMGDVRIVGPDLASTSGTWMQTMMGSSSLMSNLAHFGVHSYPPAGEGSSGVAGFLASSPYSNSTFWMTEFNTQCTPCFQGNYDPTIYDWNYGSQTAENLLYHLANGASAGVAWEGCDSYYELAPLTWLPGGEQASGWSFYGLFGVNNTNAVPKTYTARKSFYTMSQISAFVPPGAQCINVSNGQNGNFLMLAFYHRASGRVTLTGFNNNTNAVVASLVLTNLPPVASFALYYTDASTNLNQSATYPVLNGGFTATIPSNCVFTLTGFDPAKIAVAVQITNPVGGAQFTAPATIPLAASASTTTGGITNVTFFNGATPLGACSNAPWSMDWSNVAPGVYTVAASAADSMGHTTVSTNVTFTVVGPPAQILITPTNAILNPGGAQQFNATVVDALGTPLASQPLLAWSAGGGVINSAGWYLSDGVAGGPFSVIASNGGLSCAATLTVSNTVNIAPSGIGYIWYSLFTNTANTPQMEAPAINDGDTLTEISLLTPFEASVDLTNAYEAAGVIWTNTQAITSFVFINGTTIGANGTFDAGFQLQFSGDGVNWAPAGPQWAVTPAYSYNSSRSSPTQYVFSGPATAAMGVRCVGQVSNGHNRSGAVYATEVQAYSGVAPLPPLQARYVKNAGVIISWATALTNCVLQTTPDLSMPWATATNAPQYNGPQTSITIDRTNAPQFFRLGPQ